MDAAKAMAAKTDQIWSLTISIVSVQSQIIAWPRLFLSLSVTNDPISTVEKYWTCSLGKLYSARQWLATAGIINTAAVVDPFKYENNKKHVLISLKLADVATHLEYSLCHIFAWINNYYYASN